MDIRQTIVSTAVAIGQAFVVNTQKMHNRGMEVVHMDSVFRHRRGEFIGAAVTDPCFDSGSSHPGREAGTVMTATLVAIDTGRAAELGGPHKQRVFQHGLLFRSSSNPAIGLSMTLA